MARSRELVSFDLKGLPSWDQQCTAVSKRTRVRCRRKAILGGFVCYWHGGNKPKVREAGEHRYIAWLLTGQPDHRFYEVAVQSLYRHILKKRKLSDEQMLMLAVKLLDSVQPKGD